MTKSQYKCIPLNSCGHPSQTFWRLIGRTDDNNSVQTYHLNQLWPPNVFFPAYWKNELELMRTSGYQVTHVTQSGHSPHVEEKWNRERNWYFFVFNNCYSEWLAHPHYGDLLPAIGEELEFFIFSFYAAIYLSWTLVKVISAVKLAESANDFCRLRQLFFRSSIISSYLRRQRIHPPSSSPPPSSPLTWSLLTSSLSPLLTSSSAYISTSSLITNRAPWDHRQQN